jgi:hypothetical protein
MTNGVVIFQGACVLFCQDARVWVCPIVVGRILFALTPGILANRDVSIVETNSGLDFIYQMIEQLRLREAYRFCTGSHWVCISDNSNGGDGSCCFSVRNCRRRQLDTFRNFGSSHCVFYGTFGWGEKGKIDLIVMGESFFDSLFQDFVGSVPGMFFFLFNKEFYKEYYLTTIESSCVRDLITIREIVVQSLCQVCSF